MNHYRANANLPRGSGAPPLGNRTEPGSPSVDSPRQANALELRIRRLLERQHRGHDYAISQADLAEAACITMADPVRKLQTVLKGMIEEHRWPVGTDCHKPAGVYWIIKRSELNESRAQSQSRAESLVSRIRAYDEIEKELFDGQGVLSPPPTPGENGDRPRESRARITRTTCQLCRRPLSGRQERFCGDPCRNMYHGELRRTGRAVHGEEDSP